MATNALLWTVGTQGSGDDQFDAPQGICTDGTYLYICDKENERIKKHLCSTGAYVAKLGTYGTALGQFITPTGICTDGTWLYITEGSPGATPLLKKHLCSDLSGVAQISADGHLDDTNCSDICTDGASLYLININTAAVDIAIFKYTRALAYVSGYGADGTGDTQFAGPYGICTDKTYLYVADSGNARIKQHLLSDYSYVAQTGTDGVGDSNFKSPRGICVGYLGEPRTGRLLRLRQDGSHFEVWPKLDLYSHLVFHEDSSAATDYVSLKAPSAITASYTLTLPAADAAGALVSDGEGALSFSSSPTFTTVKLTDLTDGYVPYHVSDSAGLANGPIRTDGSTIGIGAEQSAVSMLTVGPISVPQWGGSAIFAWGPTRAVASNETNYIDGLSFNSYFASIASGITDSGYRAALNLASYIVDTNFKGTLASQYGAYIAYGIAEAGTSGERTIVNSYGLYLSGYDYEGTITNKWGVYQVNTNFKNYFEGQIQSAVADGTAPLIVASTTAISNLNADLLDGNHAAAFQLAGAMSFVDLDDVPASYVGEGGKIVKVKADASGLEFVAGGAGVTNFNDLGDVPASYVGQAGKYPKVNVAENGLEYGSGGTGAPTAAKYIVGLAHADLSAEKVKPQLYNNYDIDDTPAAPNALDDEFDDSSLDVKWTAVNNPGAPNAISETAFPGYIWVGLTELGTDNYANAIQLYQATPATGNFAMEFIAKVSVSMLGEAGESGEFAGVAVALINDTDSQLWGCSLDFNDNLGINYSCRAGGYKTAAGAFAGSTTMQFQVVDASSWTYIKLAKTTTAAYTSANTYVAYFSKNGIIWHEVGTESFTFTTAPGRVGLIFRRPKSQAGTPLGYALVDFFRRTV
jgi:hypothetical protein